MTSDVTIMYNVQFSFLRFARQLKKKQLEELKTTDEVGGFTAKFWIFYTLKCGQKIVFKCVEYRKCGDLGCGWTGEGTEYYF